MRRSCYEWQRIFTRNSKIVNQQTKLSIPDVDNRRWEQRFIHDPGWQEHIKVNIGLYRVLCAVITMTRGTLRNTYRGQFWGGRGVRSAYVIVEVHSTSRKWHGYIFILCLLFFYRIMGNVGSPIRALDYQRDRFSRQTVSISFWIKKKLFNNKSKLCNQLFVELANFIIFIYLFIYLMYNAGTGQITHENLTIEKS